MNTLDRLLRHARITVKNYQALPSPPFLVLFINSICNMKCEHCFYWRNLNRGDDLSKEELFELSRSMGQIENLNLSGGEPFLRKEFAEICVQFIRQNKVRQIYVPTNGYFTDKIISQVAKVLEEKELELFAVELSLDGMPEYHDRFRGSPGAFAKAIRTYDALAELQAGDSRLRVHSVVTATSTNLDEIKLLSAYLLDRCPRMDHYNLAILRGERRNPALLPPDLQQYQQLYEYIRRMWSPREVGRYGGSVEPILQWAKLETAKKQTQAIPCRAGHLSAVVYANGDVSICELHKPVGNLREKSFQKIWSSEEARSLRESVARKECYCTTEVFLWPSIVYQPARLAEAMIAARVWEKPEPLGRDERVNPASFDLPPTAAPTPAPRNLDLGSKSTEYRH